MRSILLAQGGNMDDKLWVIISVTILGIVSVYAPSEVDLSLLNQIITGLFGVAVGRGTLKLKKGP